MERLALFAVIVVLACAVGIGIDKLGDFIVDGVNSSIDKEMDFTEKRLDKSISSDDRKRIMDSHKEAGHE